MVLWFVVAFPFSDRPGCFGRGRRRWGHFERRVGRGLLDADGVNAADVVDGAGEFHGLFGAACGVTYSWEEKVSDVFAVV